MNRLIWARVFSTATIASLDAVRSKDPDWIVVAYQKGERRWSPHVHLYLQRTPPPHHVRRGGGGRIGNGQVIWVKRRVKDA
jgi:hypothetical protein